MRFVTYFARRDGVSVSEIGVGEKPKGFSPSDFRPETLVPAKVSTGMSCDIHPHRSLATRHSEVWDTPF